MQLTHAFKTAASFILFFTSAAVSHAAPGEDPVTLNGRVSYLQIPTARPAKSSDILHKNDIPDNAKAKIARYIANSYTPEKESVYTEKDVVSTVQTSGTKTTCVQTLAPTSPNGKSPSEQVVVIRGDLVNLCR